MPAINITLKPCVISEWKNSTQSLYGYLLCPDISGIDKNDLGIKGEFGDHEFFYFKFTFN